MLNRFAVLLASCCVAGSVALTSTAQGQQAPSKAPAAAVNPVVNSAQDNRVGLLDFFTTRTPYEFWLTVLVALTGLATIFLMLRALEKTTPHRPEDVTRPLIVVLITTSSLMLVIAGFSNEQIAPAFGLFGTIVGYMLGRMSATDASRQPEPDPGRPPLPNQPVGGSPAITAPQARPTSGTSAPPLGQ